MLWNNGEKSMIIVFILVTIFSLCQNILFYGIHVELPVLVDALPEGWKLPAIFNLIGQIAAISILLTFLVRHITKSNSYEGPAIIVILTIGTFAFVILGLTWQKSTLINEKYHSTYFLLLSFIIYVCDHNGTLLFLPYLHRYQSIMIRAFFSGDALSSGSLALLGFVQVSDETKCTLVMIGNQTELIESKSSLNYPIETYFYLLSLIMLSSLIAFLILFFTKIGQITNEENIQLVKKDGHEEEEQTERNKKVFCLSHYHLCLLAMFWTCFITYGFLPGLQTYALASYSAGIYQKTIIAIEIGYIFVQILCAIYSHITIATYPRLVFILNITATILVIYIFIVAKMSPCPPLINHLLIGGLISSFIYIVINGINHFIFVLLNIHLGEIPNGNGLFWGCVMVQCGTFLGAFVNYILTVHFNLFRERFPCVDYTC